MVQISVTEQGAALFILIRCEEARVILLQHHKGCQRPSHAQQEVCKAYSLKLALLTPGIAFPPFHGVDRVTLRAAQTSHCAFENNLPPTIICNGYLFPVLNIITSSRIFLFVFPRTILAWYNSSLVCTRSVTNRANLSQNVPVLRLNRYQIICGSHHLQVTSSRDSIRQHVANIPKWTSYAICMGDYQIHTTIAVVGLGVSHTIHVWS